MPRSPLLTTLRAMILNRVRLRLDSRGDPATPPADAWELYVRSSDSALVAKDSGGTVTDLTAGGGGGTMDHAALTGNLAWTTSGHTGTASRLAGFTGAGAAEATTVSTGLSHAAGALAVDFGTTGATACVGNDARLTDARTPTAHATSHEPGGSDAMAVDAAAATGSLRTLGTGATQAAPGTEPAAAIAAHVAAGDPHTQYALESALGTLAAVNDAPSDGTSYHRQDAAWTRTLIIENRTSDPGAPVAGQVWLRTDL